ncbi:hypothetical protein YOLOSWAG_16 [Erwinia phage vB_EamM_Yoloswag]|uniref:Methyltransferase n=1 Tax=Erwinia phage vB_EamM_Yoloswag TaxID=1958956 RepID=A0A1S6L2V9_9CAUD|nr:tRNA methyltransferase [Erwinia phage vB_EamM_Yoloswag]AQT28503.1 hypothetical protein YOLOSWAG_16 [Erwinia phage vB_EamM_Yoloswag]
MNVDKTMPQGKWEFDEPVAAVFDSMLQNSIPSYDRMRDLTYRIGRKFVQPGTTIVDLGASLGRAIEPFAEEFGAYLASPHHVNGEVSDIIETGNYYDLYEVSDPMRSRLVQNEVLQSVRAELRDESLVDVQDFARNNGAGCSLILSVLTLQFTPLEHRQRILDRISNSLNAGGAFILVEKVLGDSHALDDMMVDVYYSMKGDNGYTKEAIAAKRKSLEGVLVPMKASWNEELLRQAGFRHVDCFYRDLNFAGWIAVK